MEVFARRLLPALSALMGVAGVSCGSCSERRSPADPVMQDAGSGNDVRADTAEAMIDLPPLEAEPPPVDAGADPADAPNRADATDSGEGPDGGCTSRPVIRPGYVVFACSSFAQWEIQTPAAYQATRTGLDEMVTLLDRSFPAIQARLDRPLPLPLQVVIEQGSCCASFSAEDHFGLRGGTFADPAELDWTRGALLGAVVNAAVARVSRGWPADWWVDDGFFTGLVVVDVLKEVATPAVATAWEMEQQLRSSPIYLALERLRQDEGWAFYDRFFDLIKGDGLDLTVVGSNPSPIRSTYVVAYLSLAAERNLGATFQDAGVADVDAAAVAAVMDTRRRLIEAEQAGTDTAGNWAAFRVGDLEGAVQGL